MTDQDLALQLVEGKTPLEVITLISSAHLQLSDQEEKAKKHPLVGFSLSKSDWQAFRTHCTDGGGVFDDTALRMQILTALNSDDQVIFWPALVHLFKSWMKQKGNISQLPGGAVQMGPMTALSPSQLSIQHGVKPPKT